VKEVKTLFTHPNKDSTKLERNFFRQSRKGERKKAKPKWNKDDDKT